MVGRSPNQTREVGSEAEAGHCPEEQGPLEKGREVEGEYCWYRAGDRGTLECRARLLMELGGWRPGVLEPQLGTSVYR